VTLETFDKVLNLSNSPTALVGTRFVLLCGHGLSFCCGQRVGVLAWQWARPDVFAEWEMVVDF
jgi:hypothetical protein